MKTTTKTITILLSLLLMVAGIGCVAVSKWATPATIDNGAVGYVVSTGVADPNDFLGYPNLIKAEKLQIGVDSAHTIVQFGLDQLKQKDNLDYSIHRNIVANNVTIGQQREEMLFGEKGLLSLGFSMLGMGTLTGVLGLMRKRPGDVTKDEMQQVLAETQGKTIAELTEKEIQLIQLVKGFEKLKNTFKSDVHLLDTFKTIMNTTQDINTQVAVARIKKTI